MNELSVSRAHGGTTFIITDDQWHRLVAEAGGWPTGAPEEQGQTILAVEEAIHPGRHGQGRLDPCRTTGAIELHAMKVVRDDYERRDGASRTSLPIIPTTSTVSGTT